MILTHESGFEEDQFDEKMEAKNSHDSIPLMFVSYPVRGKFLFQFQTHPD
jgi:hypothetical protein